LTYDGEVKCNADFRNTFERSNTMKRCVFGMVLAAMVLLPPAAFCQEAKGPEDFERQMQMREREMEVQGRQAKMEMDRRMAELELAKRKMELAQLEKARRHGPGPLLLLGIVVVHILAAVWVYHDIRQRGCGSGLWVVIALLGGLLGTLVYAVVRLGDGEKKRA
jgi:hypothetical protein